MNKLDLQPTSLTYAESNTDLESVHRLVVLVPKDMDYSAATRRVWELANDMGVQHVQLLGLCRDASGEPELRRGLVVMISLLQDSRIFVEAYVDIGTSWVDSVKSHWQADDMLVCCAEQRTGWLHRPLSQILQSDLDAPLYILTGLHPQNETRSNWLSRAAAWTGSIAIIAGFFVLQTRISLLTDWSQTILMLLSTAVEVWAVWIWNNFFE